MSIYYNTTTGDTAKVNSEKADKDGNVWVEIDGRVPEKRNWEEFIKEFSLASVKIEPFR